MSDAVAVAQLNVGSALTDALRAVLLFLPKAIGFVLILLVGWLVARVVRAAVDRVLERVGFDRAVERGGIRTMLARSRYDASDLVGKLVYYAILLFTLQLAFGIWGPNPVSDLIRGIVAWLPKAFVAIVIVVVAAAVASAVRDIVAGALGELSYGRFLANVTSWFIVGVGVIAALNQIGIATTVTEPVLIAVLATIAGILVVGVGGGLVRPMQGRWDRWLDRAGTESQAIAERARAYQAGQTDAREALRTEPAATEPATSAPAGSVPATSAPGNSAPAGPGPANAVPGNRAPAAPVATTAEFPAASAEETQVLPTTGQQPPTGRP